MKITLPIPPLSTNHGYHTSYGRWYKDRKLVDWERECLLILDGYTNDIHQEYAVDMWFFYGNKRKNDIDGRIKPVLDILQKAGFYKDDSLVTDLTVRKRYDKENPRLEIEMGWSPY